MDISRIPRSLLRFRPYKMIRVSLGDCKAYTISFISSSNSMLLSSLASDFIRLTTHGLPSLGISTPPPFVTDILKGLSTLVDQRLTVISVQVTFQMHLRHSSTTYRQF